MALKELERASPMSPLVLHTRPVFDMDDEAFFAFCQLNNDMRIERTAQGEIEIMPPAGGESGRRNAGLTAALYNWAEKEGTGVVFDSSTGFVLPNGAIRSPDVAWVQKARLAQLTVAERERFLPLAPDFVIELRSIADRPGTLHDKMAEYIDNGVRLGWLIDPLTETVTVYRPGIAPHQMNRPASIQGDPELPGLSVKLGSIW